MSYILERNLGISLNDADLNMVAEEESLNSDAEEEDLSKILPKFTDLNEFFGGTLLLYIYQTFNQGILEL